MPGDRRARPEWPTGVVAAAQTVHSYPWTLPDGPAVYSSGRGGPMLRRNPSVRVLPPVRGGSLWLAGGCAGPDEIHRRAHPLGGSRIKPQVSSSPALRVSGGTCSLNEADATSEARFDVEPVIAGSVFKESERLSTEVDRVCEKTVSILCSVRVKRGIITSIRLFRNAYCGTAACLRVPPGSRLGSFRH